MLRSPQFPCGSELARDRAGSGNISGVWFTAIASKLAPTGIPVSSTLQMKKNSLNPLNQKPWVLQQRYHPAYRGHDGTEHFGISSRHPSGCGFPFDCLIANRLIIVARPAVLRMSEQK
ncbi:hypothetical protein [Pseudomonas sp. NFACC13-1]|uniref:hypothetical protein n=1 Tax=Pseudomonas sp. NFACC13-1 TaxID=1566245 RepID=UPI0015A39F84|nr:hypothetical protein [Pseudomonas sp. NFACC13-1]